MNTRPQEPSGPPPGAVFERDGDVILPTELALGPWDPDAQHGGAASGLLAWASEQVPTLVPMRVARITIDLMRRVPLTPLTWRSEIVREGKLIQVVDVALVADGVEVARASVLRIRTGAGLDLSDIGTDLSAPAGPTGHLSEPPPIPGFVHAVDFDGPPIGTPGPKPEIRWCRLRVPLVAGEDVSPLVRMVALSDFTSGFGNELPFDRYTSINPDLCIQVLREPVGDWIGIAAVTDLHPDGIGLSGASMYDFDGRVARTSTSLLVRER